MTRSYMMCLVMLSAAALPFLSADQYANAVFLVTSGESMAIYAANNILCGIKNLNPNGSQIAGIIYNSRGVGDESKRVEDSHRLCTFPFLPASPEAAALPRQKKKP